MMVWHSRNYSDQKVFARGRTDHFCTENSANNQNTSRRNFYHSRKMNIFVL